MVVEKKNMKLAGTPYEEWTGGIVDAGDYRIYAKSDKYDIAKTAGTDIKVNTVAVHPMETGQIFRSNMPPPFATFALFN